MSTSDPRRVNATDTDEQDSFSQTLQSYTSLVNGLLDEADVADDEDMNAVRSLSSQLVDEAEEIEEGVKANEESVSETRELVADTRREQADVRSRVSDVEDDVEADETDEEGGSGEETPTPETGETGTHEPQTPLGDCVTLPETVANGELTANVKRARDVAADVIDYGRSVPAGYAITSSELRTVLTALKDDEGRTFTETVGRVMEYLDELGGEEVTVKETRGGQRTVVFDDAFVRRTVSWRQSSSHAVVAGTGASGAT
jgi:hypothetical protein